MKKINITKSKISLFIALLMTIIGVVFVLIAVNNPQLSWRMPLEQVFMIYKIYLIIMGLLYIAAFVFRVLKK
ncbi:MAG: hypothetical protein FWH08_00840 [Oscillospiraceae bacterium]|nr:hypothetical protein [Oscillospiraceae bacterium]